MFIFQENENMRKKTIEVKKMPVVAEVLETRWNIHAAVTHTAVFFFRGREEKKRELNYVNVSRHDQREDKVWLSVYLLQT